MASFKPERWDYSHQPSQEIDVNTIDIDTNVIRTVSRIAAIAIVGALAVSFAVDTVAARTNTTGGAVVASFGEYITEVGEALGSG